MFPARRISLLIAAVLALGVASGGRAQPATDLSANPLVQPAKSAPTPEASSSAPAKREHALSSDVAATLASVLPKYNPAPKAREEPADLRETDKPKNGIIRLPKYEVRVTKEPKPMVFTETELLTGKGMAEIAMKRNPGLHIGNIFGWNTGIAIMMYQEQLRLNNMADMDDLANNAPEFRATSPAPTPSRSRPSVPTTVPRTSAAAALGWAGSRRPRAPRQAPGPKLVEPACSRSQKWSRGASTADYARTRWGHRIPKNPHPRQGGCLRLQQLARDRLALGVEGDAFRRRSPAGPDVPVAGVGEVAFLAVQVGVHPAARRPCILLGKLMRACPLAPRVVPQR